MDKFTKSQLAVGSYHYSLYSFDYFLKSMNSIGVKNIELWAARPHFCIDYQTKETALEMKRKINENGLNLVCVCPEQNTFPVDISSKEEELRENSLKYMKKAIKLTHYMGCDKMLVCPGTGYLDEPMEDIENRCLESLDILSREAKKYDVTLLLEPQGLEESLILNNVYQQKKMLDTINHPNLKAMIDTVQMAMFDPGLAKNFEILGDDIAHIHMGNTNLFERVFTNNELENKLTQGKQSIGHTGIMDGELPLDKYIEELKKVNYKNYVTLEICSPDYFIEAEKHAINAYNMVVSYV